MNAKRAATTAAPADPCCFVIFGASGDLTHRLLMPALYNLAAGGLLPDAFSIIGVARGEKSDEAFRDDLVKGLRHFATVKIENEVVDRLLSCVGYVSGDADDSATYQKLEQVLARVERERDTHRNRLFYLATPPTAFAPIGRHLGQTGLACEENGAWRRLIVEKPFGIDLASAQALNRQLLELLEEHQIYRIDHYLGKETVQNILVLRFANGLFEPIWNRDHIDHVQITVAETLAVGRRGRFYDETGALRDMVPNHLFQLLSLVTMEPPSRFEAGAVRSENAKVPGPSIRIGGVGMTFRYKDYFDAAPSTGYETLIYDCMIGDAILFQRADGVEAGWRIVQPFLDAWRNAGGQGLASYHAGTLGPAEAEGPVRHDGRCR